MIACSPTDDQPPPRQEGEAVVIPWSRQVRNEAGVGGCARDYFAAGEVVFVFGFAIIAAHHHLPLILGGDTRDEEEAKK